MELALHWILSEARSFLALKHFIKEKSVLEHALFREVIRQACVRGGKSAAELLSFVMEVGIDNVKVAKSLKDLQGNVHPTTMQSMMEYCERKHRNNEEKMLNAAGVDL
eukprot:g3680.t1 g3680   contig12:2546903-2547226(-)